MTSDFGRVTFSKNGPVLLVKAVLTVDAPAIRSKWTDVCSVPNWVNVTNCWGTTKNSSGRDSGIWDITDKKLKVYLNDAGENSITIGGLMMFL